MKYHIQITFSDDTVTYLRGRNGKCTRDIFMARQYDYDNAERLVMAWKRLGGIKHAEMCEVPAWVNNNYIVSI